jgi:hypothetical protein
VPEDLLIDLAVDGTQHRFAVLIRLRTVVFVLAIIAVAGGPSLLGLQLVGRHTTEAVYLVRVLRPTDMLI